MTKRDRVDTMDRFSPVRHHQQQPDEGYSEEPLNPPLSIDIPSTLPSFSSHEELINWYAAYAEQLPVSAQQELTERLLKQLPTSVISEIVRKLHPRLYIDFVRRLPAEICLKILSYLDPESLVNVLRTCRSWCNLGLDRKLWERLYHLEGWKAHEDEIALWEERVNSGLGEMIGHLNSQALPEDRPAKIRALLDEDEIDVVMSDNTQTSDDFPRGDSLFGGLAESRQHTDSSGSSRAGKRAIRSTAIRSRRRGATQPPILQPQSADNLRQSTMWQWDAAGSKYRINWKYLYNMRRQLETNWELGKYAPFQLPHPMFPEEGHNECIYALQFDKNWLVSGSRDKTMRVWNVHTRRLVRPPLVGHKGSVLCLQFDADPAEDLLVSGSSDSDVMIWKFSTGELLQTLSRAHRESVLNVRFDKRVLVTSSKDKSIKIFNRQPLKYGDHGYNYGKYATVHPVPRVVQGYEMDIAQHLPVQPPFCLIGRLEGHNAAVNAIQVRGDTIVSVSGDRHIKIWNWPQSVCTQNIPAHDKGIACVEFDGRRIVSGSSDFEVSIFDAPTGLRVASLRGHSHLVRTVQAGFADLPYSQHEDPLEAKRVDAEYFKAVDAGLIQHEGERSERRSRQANAGSSRPADLQAYGAKLPPGGGGGKTYARIISGSYDQSVIVWRRDKEGVWKPAHHLRQEEASALAQRRGTLPDQRELAANLASPAQQAFVPCGAPLPMPNVHDAHPNLSSVVYTALIDELIPAGVNALEQALSNYPGLLAHAQYLRAAIQREPMREKRNHMLVIASEAEASRRVKAIMSRSSEGSRSSRDRHHNTPGHLPAAPGQGPAPSVQAQPQVPQVQQGAPPAEQQQQQPHPHIAAPPDHSPARIFKLQFDARKIVCVSQATVIVGWDFCNESVELEEACRFFAKVD